jgi:septal ring factor EnvC (AmiA/AmiB activator)
MIVTSIAKQAYHGAVEKKGALATIATIVAIVAALIGTYVTLSNNLTTAKAARDEQMKGYAVQIGVLHTEVNGLKEDIENMRKWNKSMSERLNAQEKSELARQSDSLENRINRLEDAAMSAQRKKK